MLIISACNKETTNNASIIVGTSADNNPYEFIQDQQIVGFDIDLIQEIGKKLGRKVEIKSMNFNGLIPALVSKDMDLAIAGITETNERKINIDFSSPYDKANVSLISTEQLKIHSINDLENKILGSQIGSTWYQTATSIANKINGVKVKALSSNLLLIEEVKLGNIDAIVLETSQASKIIGMYNQLNKFELDEAETYLSIAFPKNSDLKESVDKVILELQNNGYLESLRKKWFNET